MPAYEIIKGFSIVRMLYIRIYYMYKVDAEFRPAQTGIATECRQD